MLHVAVPNQYTSCTFVLFLQTFDRRTSVVKESEMDHWKMLSYQYMTEESDANDEPNAIILHKLEWRSESKLSKLNN